jgi:hypothetical protein
MRTASVLLLFAFVGCNDDRVTKLEKQTAALELQAAQAQKSGHLEQQDKCAKDARECTVTNGVLIRTLLCCPIRITTAHVLPSVLLL